MLTLAVIYEDDPKRVFVAMKPEDFIYLLEEYYKKYKSFKKSIEKLEFDIKQKTMYK